MAGLRQTIIRGGLESLYFSGAHAALKPFVGGVGVILTLHHVRPPRPGRFQPNRLLEITPHFLTRVVKLLRRSGLDLVSLDEMHRRLTEGDFARRFVCLTFDDGYRDTLTFAYPILKAAGVPFAVYVASSFPDRLGELWWLALEAVIANNNHIGLVIDGDNRTFACTTLAEKRALYGELYWWLRRRPTEAETRAIVRNLAACYQVDIAAFCKELCMDWPELAQLAADPLVTIGAHTVNHPVLARLPADSYYALCDRGRKWGLPVVGCVPDEVSVWDAIDARQKSMEHLTGVALACSREEDHLRRLLLDSERPIDGTKRREYSQRVFDTYDPARAEKLFQRMALFESWQTPTLVMWSRALHLDAAERFGNPELQRIPRAVRADWPAPASAATPAAIASLDRRTWDLYMEMVARMQADGVPLLAGSGTGNAWTYPGEELHKELELLVKAGLTPAEALRTATVNPAKFLDAVGTS